ncbi:hypothetical protein [Edaphobacter albus]|uniref:hypothetical protein n=1 Tax=Edaphobacter sp. 4G125 TaxID=2763071 RepID=UPI0016451148|nr:hypothetical protein [Edaphobacter sp. 4G125]QNI35248.1 hypothetical protein H7846_09000 [Edaphobacter sp. 4G125]
MSLKLVVCILALNLGVTCLGQITPSSKREPETERNPAPQAVAERAQVQAVSALVQGPEDEIVPLSCVAAITSLNIGKNVVTFKGMNRLEPSQQVRISKLNHATYLNDVTLTVTSATPSSFSAAFTHSDVDWMTDLGTALRTDCIIPTSLRSEQKVDIVHNNLNYYRRHLSTDMSLFSYDSFFPMEQDARYSLMTFNQPSYSWGNHGGWGVQKGTNEEMTFNSRGIAQTKNLWCYKHATGDIACGDYVYGYTDGGATAQSDEGFTMDTREGGESDRYFHGKAGEGATAGTTMLPVVFTSGQEATTDGAFLLDISKGTIAGTISGADSIVDGTSVHILPVTLRGIEKLPASTGMGIIQTPLPVVAVANTPESITLEVTLKSGSFHTGVACLAGGWYPEQVTVTAAESSRGGVQRITVVHKNPNPTAVTDPNNPSSLWQGGLCGNYLSLDRNLARDGFRTSYPVVGATDSSHVAYVWNVNGSVRQNGIRIYASATSLKNLVRKNGVVTADFSSPNSPYIYNRAPSVVIAGALDTSFNGTILSPVYSNGQNRSLSWKQLGPDASVASATIDLPASSYGFHLYPGAEILAPKTANGVLLEPNTVQWQPGDAIENPHNPSFNMHFRMSAVTQHTPPSGADPHAELWGFYGAGISENFRPATWVNNNPCTLYVGCGGTLEPITWTIHRGPYSILHRVDSAPMNGGILFRIGCDSQGCDHPVPYALFQMQNGSILYDPATSTVSTARLAVQEAKFNKVSLPSMPDGSYCLGVANHELVPVRGQGSGCVTGPTANSSTDDLATITIGDANAKGSANCMSGYRCTASRGRVSVMVQPGVSIGKIARVNVKLAVGQICTATQNGGRAFLGIGSGAESSSGFDITADGIVPGKVVVDYSCR